MRPDPLPSEAERPGFASQATAMVRTYTRAFVAQSVGIVGLAWCLVQTLPLVAVGLTALVLIDQALFLRNRARLDGAPRLQVGLDIWCLLVSGADVVLLLATLYRAGGLRDIAGAAVQDPLSCLAFAIATLTSFNLGLVPAGVGGRLLAAGEAMAGGGLLLALIAILLWAALRGRGITRP